MMLGGQVAPLGTLGALTCLALLGGCATMAPNSRALVPASVFSNRGAAWARLPKTARSFPATSSGSIYEPKRDWRPGDLVAIDIVTSTTAVDNDAAALSRAGTVANSVTSFFGVPLNFGSLAGVPFFAHHLDCHQATNTAGTGTETASNNITGEG